MEKSMSLYHKKILLHAKQPLHRGIMAKPDDVFVGKNPLCGDELTFYLKLKKGFIVDALWQGSGCAISQAAASLFSDMIIGKKLASVQKWDSTRILTELEIDLSPSRIKCAILPLYTLKQVDIND
jgi:nitrogen fixation NifU-like protein